jgi:hypothetical protein
MITALIREIYTFRNPDFIIGCSVEGSPVQGILELVVGMILEESVFPPIASASI